MSQAIIIFCLVMCLLLPSLLYAKEQLSPIVLAKHFTGAMQSPSYWTSEKLDGIRCYWDGKNLQTRNGNIIQAPKWFTQALPVQAFDGEIWAGRGGYQTVTQIVLDATTDDAQRRKISYQVFDLHQSRAQLQSRQQTLK